MDVFSACLQGPIRMGLYVAEVGNYRLIISYAAKHTARLHALLYGPGHSTQFAEITVTPTGDGRHGYATLTRAGGLPFQLMKTGVWNVTMYGIGLGETEVLLVRTSMTYFSITLMGGKKSQSPLSFSDQLFCLNCSWVTFIFTSSCRRMQKKKKAISISEAINLVNESNNLSKREWWSVNSVLEFTNEPTNFL